MQPTGTECAPNRPSPGPQKDWNVSDRAEPSRSWNLALPVIVAAVLAYTSWPALRAMVEAWSRDPRYTHGWLVPPFAAFLLWHRRPMLEGPGPGRPSWWGVPLIAAGEALRLVGTRYYVTWFEGLALLPGLAGLALLAGGPRALRWSAPAIAFLVFMIPLPYRLEHALGGPLQGLATSASTYLLQTLGVAAVAEGYIIHLDKGQVGVVEACNGLGMLVTFFAYAAGAAILIRRDWWQKLAILLSAAPIALAANVVRIVATGFLHDVAGGEVADAVYHDLAGWLMMPLALAVFWAELWLLPRLLVEVEVPSGAPVGLDLSSNQSRPRAVPRPSR